MVCSTVPVELVHRYRVGGNLRKPVSLRYPIMLIVARRHEHLGIGF